MKVCINFGDIRCVVPVGDGSLAVKEVIDLAVERYRKATSKPAESKIVVHSLKTCDGAILDLDDILNHVADDREQLIALFDEFPDGSSGGSINHKLYEKSNSNGSLKSKPNGIYGQVNRAPTHHLRQPQSIQSVNEAAKGNVNHHNSASAIVTNGISSTHSMNHYATHLNGRSEGIYGRTSANPNNPTPQYLYAFHQRNNHHRNDSISDSLLSSNESPDVFQHGTLTPDSTHYSIVNNHRMNVSEQHNRSASYSYRTESKSPKPVSINGFQSGQPRQQQFVSYQCQNTSVTSPIVISNNNKNSDRNDFYLSRSYDPKYVTSHLVKESFHNSSDVVEITPDQINSYSSNVPILHVRHGSEPTLNQSPTLISRQNGNINSSHANQSRGTLNGMPNGLYVKPTEGILNDQSSKRWSTAVAVGHTLPSRLYNVQLDANYEHSDEEKSFNSVSPHSTKEEGYASEERPNSQMEPTPTQTLSPPSNATSPQQFGKFTRGSGRLSMLANNFDVWADAADRQIMRQKHEHINSPKEQPVNRKSDHFHIQPQQQQQQIYDSSLGSMTSNSSQENESQSQPKPDQISVIINLAKESGPLGIHVLPDTKSGSVLSQGLCITGIEPGGRIDCDGRLHVGDNIVEVDGHKFAGLEFTKAQEIFRSSLQNEKIKLSIVKTSTLICDSPLYSPTTTTGDQRFATNNQEHFSNDYQNDTKENENLVEGEARAGQQTKLATVTATRKHSTGMIQLPNKPPTSALVVANTRRIGKKYHIQLKKGQQSLGFSITTRDNPAGGQSPIYIKTIQPQGAAVQDGRLKPGDRLLEVCGIEMTGKTQDEAVKILRNLPQDSIVDLIVSRQELEMSPSPLMPRQLPPEKVDESKCSSSNEREVMAFQVPLNDTGSAGLGVSVKGKTSTVEGKQVDLGIFVKTVIHGGAASKDGRLRQDDQLLSINEIPLSGKSNSEATDTLRRAMIQPQLKNDHSNPNATPNSITLTIARRVCRSPSHCTEATSTEQTYRHQHEASILSSDSFDLSFNGDANTSKSSPTSPYNANHSASHESSGHEEDSYRSSDNTVIYNIARKDLSPQSNPNNDQYHLDKSLNNSELSLIDDDGGERFKRDGFGRQSMSEKRHAQLDAKSTDTYRRNKKSRDETQMMSSPSDSSQIGSGGKRANQVSAHSYGEDEQTDQLDIVQRINSTVTKENVQPSTNTSTETPPKSRSPVKNQMLLFSPCCTKCQSPGSCPYHSKSDLDPNGSRNRNGVYVKNMNVVESRGTNSKELIVSPFGLRRSCSLESLQMMMQDLQKEQLEKVGGNITGFTGARHGTVRVARSRETNESFRVAVDRSYEIKNYINSANMDRVDEEYDSQDEDKTVSRQTSTYTRVGGGHSMVSTNYTTGTTITNTTNDEDNAQLIKQKKKKSLFKNLFHFGSRKGRSKSASSEPTQRYNHNNSHTSDEIYRSPELNRKYQIEQDKINMEYRKLMEQKQRQQSQPPTFVRNQLHPMHQSMPIGQRTKASPNSKIDNPMIESPNGTIYHPGFAPANSAQHYGTNVMHRDTVGVPQLNKNDKFNAYMRQNHRVHPEMKMNEGNHFGDPNTQIRHNEGPRHLRGNSHDYYSRTMDRPGSRVAISENSNYATQGIYSTYGANVSSNGLSPSAQLISAQRANNNSNSNIDNNNQHYRQLSLRNTQHHRQVSSPATSQQYYTQQRPVSSYYEHAPYLKNGDQHKIENQLRKGPANHLQQQQQQQQQQHSNFNQIQQSIYGTNKETLYGIVGQQLANKRPMVPTQQMVPSGPPNIIRQQQPIYQSNQVQIYGSVYNQAPNYGQQQQQRQTNNSRPGLYSSFPRSEAIYGHTNGLPPNAYLTKG